MVRQRQVSTLLTQWYDLILGDLVEGHTDTWSFTVYESKLASYRFPGKGIDDILTLNSIYWHLLLLYMEDLKVISHSLEGDNQMNEESTSHLIRFIRTLEMEAVAAVILTLYLGSLFSIFFLPYLSTLTQRCSPDFCQ